LPEFESEGGRSLSPRRGKEETQKGLYCLITSTNMPVKKKEENTKLRRRKKREKKKKGIIFRLLGKGRKRELF